MSTIYILRVDNPYSDAPEDIPEIAKFDTKESAESYKAAYAITHPDKSTLIYTEEIYNGVQEFAPLYHYSAMVPTVGDTGRIGDNKVIKTHKVGLKVEGLVNKLEYLPSSGVSYSKRHAGTRITPEGPIHRYEQVLVVEAYGYSETEVKGWVEFAIAELREMEASEI